MVNMGLKMKAVEYLNSFVNLDKYDFSKKNKATWIPDEDIREIYLKTKGPHASPDPVECWILYNLSLLSEGNILEIGSWQGRSACFLGTGIKNSNPARKLTCVDWFLGDNTGGKSPDKVAMINSVNGFGLNDIITIHDANMLEIDYSKIIDNVDLVFYDSDHNTEPTIKVLSAIHPYLNKNCILTIHDANWGMTRNAIKGVEDKYTHLKTLPVWEGFALLMRKD